MESDPVNYAYVARISMAAPSLPGHYVLKYVTTYIPPGPSRLNVPTVCTLAEATPPTHRRRSDGTFSWDYANKPIRAREFHRLYPHIRLKPDEGPILVDLEHTTQNRTSRHPDDT